MTCPAALALRSLFTKAAVERAPPLKGRYVVEATPSSFLGVGATGSVYKGWDEVDGAHVAVKFFQRGREKDQVMEVSLLRLLNGEESFAPPRDPRMWCPALQQLKRSDAFITMLDHSTRQDGTPGRDPTGLLFIVMELGEHDLKQFLDERFKKKLPPSAADVKRISKDLLLAVAGLHALGIGHQDIKPRNFVWSRGHWKLIDFAGARALGQVLENGTSTNTVLYSPPEWCRSALRGDPTTVTARHDIWGAGLTIVELVTLQGLLRDVGRRRVKGIPQELTPSWVAWIGEMQETPLPLHVLLSPCAAFVCRLCRELLVCDPAGCKTAAEVLQSDIFMDLDDGLCRSRSRWPAGVGGHGNLFLV